MPIERGCIAESIGTRSRLADDLYHSLKDLDDLDTKAKKELHGLAPKTLREWLVDNNVLNNVFTHGISEVKVPFDEEPFGDLADTRHKLSTLSHNWQGFVQVAMPKDSEGYMRVKFFPFTR